MMTIHICTYIIRLFSLQGQKLPRKSFRVPFLRQGSFFKINERNISEATKFFEGSKLAKKLKDKKLFLLKNHIVLFIAMLRILQLK